MSTTVADESNQIADDSVDSDYEPKTKAKIKINAVRHSASGHKRSREKDDESDAKKFKRVWSDEDELILLNGLINRSNEKNIKPSTVSSDDGDEFFRSIKSSLHFNVTKSQLIDKISKLKKKFNKNADKDCSLFNEHQQKLLELSKIVWGAAENNHAVAVAESDHVAAADDNDNDKYIRDLFCMKCLCEMVPTDCYAKEFDSVVLNHNPNLERMAKEMQIADLQALYTRSSFVMNYVGSKLKQLKSKEN